VRCYVGGSRPPDQVDPIASVARRSDSELVRRLEELGGTPAGLLDVPELRELLLPVLRADFEWLDTYRFQPDAPLPVPVVGFAGAVDPVVRPGTMVGWCRHTAAGFRLHTVPGDHFFLHAEASRVLELIAADLLPAVTSRRAGGARPAGTPPSGGAAARLTPPEPDEVHIWLAAVDKLPGLARASAELSTSEAAHAARIHDETDRQRFVARRVLLRRLLRRYGVDVGDLPPGPHGRPEAEPRIRFCVSHSADLVLLGFATGQDIGVGVERVRPDAARSGEGLLHPDEQAEFADLPDAERPSAALRTLAAKEAVLKAAGLRVEPSRFGFAGQSGEVWRPQAPSDLAGLAPWRVTTLALDGAFGAVAVTGRSWRLRFETVEIEEVGA
jgi:phosphopantetheinyl transferase